MTRILIIGDAVAPTGFARVIRSIFEPLRDDFKLHQLATRYDGRPHDYPWKLYPAAEGKSVYGYDRILPLVAELKPDVVFLLYDIPFQPAYAEQLRRAEPRSKVVVYSPVESGPVAPEVLRRLEGVSRYVLYTRYGREDQIGGAGCSWTCPSARDVGVGNAFAARASYKKRRYFGRTILPQDNSAPRWIRPARVSYTPPHISARRVRRRAET